MWITTRISLLQSKRNLGEIVVVATAANNSRRSGGAFNVYVVSVCVGRCEVLMAVAIEVLVCWVMTHATVKVVTLGSQEWPIFIFGVGW